MRPNCSRKASPVMHVSGDDPPTLLLHGDADETVPYPGVDGLDHPIGGQEAFNEVHHCAEVILRRADEVYPNRIDPNDPEMREAAENGRRAMNRFVGRPEDWTLTHRTVRSRPARGG